MTDLCCESKFDFSNWAKPKTKVFLKIIKNNLYVCSFCLSFFLKKCLNFTFKFFIEYPAFNLKTFTPTIEAVRVASYPITIQPSSESIFDFSANSSGFPLWHYQFISSEKFKIDFHPSTLVSKFNFIFTHAL